MAAAVVALGIWLWAGMRDAWDVARTLPLPNDGLMNWIKDTYLPRTLAAYEAAAPGARKFLLTLWVVALVDGLRWGFKRLHSAPPPPPTG